MAHTYVKINFDEKIDYFNFLSYPVGCVFCGSKNMSCISDDGNIHQTCGQCKKSFYAPNYYHIVNKKMVRK